MIEDIDREVRNKPSDDFEQVFDCIAEKYFEYFCGENVDQQNSSESADGWASQNNNDVEESDDENGEKQQNHNSASMML